MTYTFDTYTSKQTTFILATKNRALHLPGALELFKELIGPEDELIVVDGNSDDGTRDIVRNFGSLVRVFISEPDLNGSHAVNKGLLLACGKYVKILSDDDKYYPEAMEKAIAVMEEHPEIDLLLCGGTKERNGRVWNYFAPPGVNYGKSPEDVFRYRGATGVGHLFRRSSLAKLGILYPLRPNADAAFVLEFIKKGGIVRFLRINSYHHTIYDHSLIVLRKKKFVQGTRKLVREYCSRSFYLRYLLLWYSRPVIRKLRRLASYFFRNILRKEKRFVPDSMIWDGGFS